MTVKPKTKKIGLSGTKQWADSNFNFQRGCKNCCLYCYAYQMAHRFSTIHPERNGKTLDDWKNPLIDQKQLEKNFRKRSGRIMFPTTHDISLENQVLYLDRILCLLKPGNEVLITSKANYPVIAYLCKELGDYQDKIQFRFTITSTNNNDFDRWEEFAPRLNDRIKSLKLAYYLGYKTSVSIEPYLENPLNVIEMVEKYCNETIWVGTMHYLTICKEAKILFKQEEKSNLYSQVFIENHLESWKIAAKGKLRLKDSITNMIEEKIESNGDGLEKWL
jgi:DNA repair photolyase